MTRQSRKGSVRRIPGLYSLSSNPFGSYPESFSWFSCFRVFRGRPTDSHPSRDRGACSPEEWLPRETAFASSSSPQTSDVKRRSAKAFAPRDGLRLQTSDFRLQTSDFRLQTYCCLDFFASSVSLRRAPRRMSPIA